MATATIVGMKYRSTKLDESQDLILKRDFDNKFDKNAVGVYQNDKLVAYVAKGDTHMFEVGVFTARVYKKFPAAYDVRVVSEEPLTCVECKETINDEKCEIALFLIHQSPLLTGKGGAHLFGNDFYTVFCILNKRLKAIFYEDLDTLNELGKLKKFEEHKHYIEIIESEILEVTGLNKVLEDLE